ncbi:HepT-like ribonuclease domain-containing protein [Methanocaldococcus infernus]|uniref:HepT-like ribonuclease domain-containing protein n=1 Tax=Methanocaldococcus infernus TaxID=67760 RepID=UPI00373AE8ED
MLIWQNLGTCLYIFYWKIDDKKVYEIIKKDVSDLNEFIKEVKDYVNKQGRNKEEN